MKVVKVFSNNPDNTFCLQASVKSILSFYFPEKDFTESEIELNTGYREGSFSWSPETVVWLDNLGLKTKLYSSFDYEQFIEKGIDYLRKFKKGEAFEIEERRGDYKYIPQIQRAAQKMIHSKLWIKNILGVTELRELLSNPNVLAIGKTIYEWLDGKYMAGSSHFVTVVKEYSPGMWLIQDPGLPIKSNRKVSQYINNHSIFGDLIIIEGFKKG